MSRSLLSAEDPKVVAFAQACEENRNAAHPHARVKLVLEDKRAYIYVDEVGADATPPYVHRGGRFLINRETGLVHTIRGYGKRGHIVGSVEGLTEAYRAGTASFAAAPEARAHVERGRARVASRPVQGSSKGRGAE